MVTYRKPLTTKEGRTSLATVIRRSLTEMEELTDRVIKFTQSVAVQDVSIGVTDVIQIAAADVVGANAKYVQYFAEGFEANKRSRGLYNAHVQLAERVRTAVRGSLAGKIGQAERGVYGRATGPYRIGKGRIGAETLLAAINAETVGIPSRDGILIANVPALYAAAAFWRRLNFGTGSQSGQGPVVGEQFFAFSRFTDFLTGGVLVNPDPSPFKSRMPRGYWVEDGSVVPWGAHSSQGEFWLRRQLPKGYKTPNGSHRNLLGGKDQWTYTKGNVGWRFLDAGFKAYADNAPQLYEEEFKKWVADAAAGLDTKVANALRRSNGSLRSGLRKYV